MEVQNWDIYDKLSFIDKVETVRKFPFQLEARIYYNSFYGELKNFSFHIGK